LDKKDVAGCRLQVAGCRFLVYLTSLVLGLVSCILYLELMYCHETKIRVRYGETDTMGYVYYGHYATYYEVGRTEMIRELGLTYRSLEESGFFLPVVHLECRYLKPARYDDLLTVRTTILEMPTARIRFGYEIFNESGEKINEGQTSLVFTNRISRRPTRPPDVLVDALKPYYK